MKHDETVSVRLPGTLRSHLEKEQKRMSRRAGAEVKLSAVVRAILEDYVRRGERKARQTTVTANA